MLRPGGGRAGDPGMTGTGNLDLLAWQLRGPEEVSDGKR
jgi:hypothetical protein